MHVNRLVRNSRVSKGVSQLELAEALGYISPQYISNIERNLTGLSVKKYKQVCEVLDIPVEKLIRASVKDYKLNLINKVM